jgi:hypothetical protein
MNRKKLSISEHEAWQHSLLTPKCYDEIDAALDDETIVDPFNREPSSRKSDESLGRLLSILDNLPRGKDADEI